MSTDNLRKMLLLKLENSIPGSEKSKTCLNFPILFTKNGWTKSRRIKKITNIFWRSFLSVRAKLKLMAKETVKKVLLFKYSYFIITFKK